jgi:hypothetical protein
VNHVVDRSTTSFQMLNRVSISRRYSEALSRWRRGRKCGEMPENTAKNRCAPPGERNFALPAHAPGSADGSCRLVIQVLRLAVLHPGHQPPMRDSSEDSATPCSRRWA